MIICIFALHQASGDMEINAFRFLDRYFENIK